MSPGEVERLLTEHPAVREAAVIERGGYPDDRRLVAYVVPHQQHVAHDSPAVHWQQHWDRIYAQAGPGIDPAFNTVGWCSNYSGEPLSAGEMREQVDETVAQVLALQPRRILEIGCGSGLLLLRLAPRCTGYVGTDFSQGTLDRVRQQLAVSGQEVSRIELLHRSATDFEGIADGSFDIVIINSVVQYFPGGKYLAQVLAHAIQALVPGGAVFVGDVRSLQLLEAFHLSVQLYRSPALLSTTDLRRRLARQVHQDQELVLDPAFFLMLPQRLPAIQAVRIMPKGGRFQNELTHFRYQVLLHTAPVASSPEVVPWLDWDQEGLTPSALRALLMEQAPRRLGLARVPNARLQRTLQARELLQWQDGPQTVGELRSAMEGQPPTDAMDPEAFRQLCIGVPYSVHLSWARHGKDGRFDVLLDRHNVANPGAAARHDALLAPAFPVDVGSGPWDNKTNPPPGRLRSRELLPVLRAYLAARLPEHLAPEAIVVLDRLPRTTNGTVDQQALPAPLLRDVAPAAAYQPPRTYTEEQMVGLWEGVLGVRPIGVHDSFFEWGGSDLQAAQLVSRVGADFDVEMPLHTVFELPRPALMVSWVEQAWQDGQPAQPAIPSREQEAEHALSFAQPGAWLRQHLAPGRPRTSISLALYLTGPLNKAALERSLTEVVRRHEILRTTFPLVDGQPTPRVADPSPVRLAWHDLRHLALEARMAKAIQLVERAANAPFDIVRGPLIRTHLQRLGEHEHLFLLCMHHLVADDGSACVLLRELSTLYPAAVMGARFSLPELPIQYADYAAWQHTWLAGGERERLLSYWRRQLVGTPPLTLPTDRSRNAGHAVGGATYRFALPAPLVEQLDALGRQGGTTLFMVLLAALGVLLAGLSGQDDLVVGTRIAGRTRLETEGLIGPLSNLLGLRLDLAGTPSFRELLGRVREVCLDAYAHQELPFEQVVEAVAPARDPNQGGLVQVLLVLQDDPGAWLALPGIQVESLSMAASTPTCELAFGLTPTVEGLAGVLDYRTDLFDAGTAKRLVDQWRRLLSGVVVDPDKILLSWQAGLSRL